MKFEYNKNNKEYLSKALFIISVALAVLMVLKVAAFGISSSRIGGRIEKAIAQSKHDDESVKKCLAGYTEAANELKKKNIYSPPQPKPKPPICVGILGDTAIINGKGYKVNEEVGGAKIVSIDPKAVTILWEGKEMNLYPFAITNFDKSKGPAPSASKKPITAKPPVATAGQAKQNTPEPRRRPRRGGMGMGDRRKMMERLKNMSPEEREEFIRNQQRN